MHLAFITSAYRTPFFYAVARLLEQEGHDVFWLSPNRRWAQWLRRRGAPPQRILDITRFARQWQRGLGRDPAVDREELARLERMTGDHVYDIISMDDLLRRRPVDRAVRYLAVCARRVREFLLGRAIEAVSGELTWAFELITDQVAQSMGVDYWRPVSARIPEDRFGFCTSRSERDLISWGRPTEDDLRQGRTLLERFREGQRFRYMSAGERLAFKPQLGRLSTLFRHLATLAFDPDDETSLRPVPLIARHLAMVWRDWRNRHWERFEEARLPPLRPFVFATLHVQPESSIDVAGNPFTNQIEVIRTLARTLPVTHDLWVKEHRVALPKRSARFYRELAAIPAVRVIDPFADTQSILRYADLVIAVTGTATYEAALYGRPAVTLAPTIFSPVLVSDHFNPYGDSLAELLRRLPQRSVPNDERLVEFLAWLHHQTWPGVVGDAFWLPETMQPENVRRVADGYLALIERTAAERPSKAMRHADPNFAQS